MANPIQTLWQNLNRTFGQREEQGRKVITKNNYNVSDPVYQGKIQADYDKAKLQAQQSHYIRDSFRKAQYEIQRQALQNDSFVKIAYRDYETMDNYPDIFAALDLYADEASTLFADGNVLKINSNSERIKDILEDLFFNTLDINVNANLWLRTIAKYGNMYLLLNEAEKRGIIGTQMLPVSEIERWEGDYIHSGGRVINPSDKTHPNRTIFRWQGMGEAMEFENWQVAHFRLVKDSLLLPYGTSILAGARQAWRRLVMAEDMLLVHRLERSFDKRVIKVDVGAIPPDDVKSYVEDIASEFKRKSLVDPQTGQLDLKMNIMNAAEDFFIPVRDNQDATTITTLQGSSDQQHTEDLDLFNTKLCIAIRTPKHFLGYSEDGTGEGQNLAMLDVRFARNVLKLQQAFILELNKIAQIHLYILGLYDDLNNFQILMQSPTTQIEAMQLDILDKKVRIAKDALSDPGNGIPIMSWEQSQKEIFGKSEKEIHEILHELRIEKALFGELEKTSQIIKRTGVFDPVDKLYGDPDADYQEEGAPGGGGPGGPGGGPMGDMGGGGLSDADFGEGPGDEGAMDLGDVAGMEGGGDNMGPAPDVESPAGEEAPPANEQKSVLNKKDKLLVEEKHKNIEEGVDMTKELLNLDKELSKTSLLKPNKEE